MAHGFEAQAQRAVAAIDIGTSKITCLFVAPDATGQPVMAGIGHQRSRGIKSGVVIDAEEAAHALRAVLAQAERMAGMVPDRVVLSVACGRLQTARFVARCHIDEAVVTGRDVDRVLAGGEAWIARGGRTVIGTADTEWRIDGQGGILDPTGMAGRDLAVEVCAVTADEGPVRNLVAVAERCHLSVDGLFAAPVASAFAVTSEEERRVGALVVDIGAGITTIARFVDGRPVLVEALAIGGQHATFDLARGLVTTVSEAERIKTLYGTLVKAASNESELVSYTLAGEDEPTLFQVSRARIGDILAPRIDQLLGFIEERLAGGGVRVSDVGSVVLTGGASQLVGLDGAWSARFGGVARLGRPRLIGRMPAGMVTPAFATVVGLVEAAGRAGKDERGRRQRSSDDGYIGRVQQWFRDSF